MAVGHGGSGPEISGQWELRCCGRSRHSQSFYRCDSKTRGGSMTCSNNADEEGREEGEGGCDPAGWVTQAHPPICSRAAHLFLFTNPRQHQNQIASSAWAGVPEPFGLAHSNHSNHSAHRAHRKMHNAAIIAVLKKQADPDSSQGKRTAWRTHHTPWARELSTEPIEWQRRSPPPRKAVYYWVA